MEVEKETTPHSSDKSNQEVAKKSGKSPFVIVAGIIGGVFLLLMLIVVAGYAIFGISSVEEVSIEQELGQVTEEQYDLLNNKLEACKNELMVNESCADDRIFAKVDEVSAVNSKGIYKIEFLYPEYLYRNVAPQAVTPIDTVAYYMAKDFADTLVTETSKDVFMVTNTSTAASQPKEYGQINVMGKSYPVTESVDGEGFASWSYKATVYTVKLEEDLYISVIAHEGREASYCLSTADAEGAGYCTDDPRCTVQEDCTNFKPEVYSEYKTTDEELEQLFDIMESFKYTKRS